VKLASITVVAGLAAAAAAQNGTMTYVWTVGDTGNGDGNINVGESALLSLWASMDPGATGFAGSIYDIKGFLNWDTGTVESAVNLVDTLGTGPGDLQGNNDILGIEAFQLPPFFNPDFDASNPIELYRIIWTPTEYNARSVTLGDANHLNNDIYIDDFGGSVSYDPVPGSASFTVAVPAPASLALLALGGLLAGRSRR
jgi:MYXO-CTERM domain-containing protein